jgi:hypothetical protein
MTKKNAALATPPTITHTVLTVDGQVLDLTVIDVSTPSAPPTTWRPPGWRKGDPSEPYVPEDRQCPDCKGVAPEDCERCDGVGKLLGVISLHARFAGSGYYTTGNTLTPKGAKAKDAQQAEDVLHNAKLLRDAWNTHKHVWPLAQALVGDKYPLVSDPFHNEGTQGLPLLRVRLTGLTPETDGMRVIDPGDTSCFEPENWNRLPDGKRIPKGQCAAAGNGPHSFTEEWLRRCQAWGEHDVCVAFVPDNGDAWFEQIALTADIVVRLGRVPCHAPPGITASSPRGASALLVWLPASLDRSTLPKPTRDLLTKGRTFKVPFLMRKKKGMQFAYVQPGKITRVVDFGIVPPVSAPTTEPAIAEGGAT